MGTQPSGGGPVWSRSSFGAGMCFTFFFFMLFQTMVRIKVHHNQLYLHYKITRDALFFILSFHYCPCLKPICGSA